jgi:chemotaxis protein MotB
MNFKLTASIIIISAIAFSSCVSSKKYKSAESDNAKLQTELTASNNKLTAETNSANAKIAGLNKQVADLTAQNASLSKDAAAYQQIKAEEKTSQDAFDAALKAQGTSLDEIEAKLIAGLSDLIAAGIDVETSEGLLYITLPEKLLFKEGSASLDKNSAKSLSPLAKILNDYPKVQIYVIGHTDTLKIHNASFQDNWSLSTERANSIVRVFRDSYHVDPARLLSGGRGKYGPVVSNATKEGRAMNRRIQIVLNPGLNKILDMIEE